MLTAAEKRPTSNRKVQSSRQSDSHGLAVAAHNVFETLPIASKVEKQIAKKRENTGDSLISPGHRLIN
jgi:hypothetical protein